MQLARIIADGTSVALLIHIVIYLQYTKTCVIIERDEEY